MSTDLIIAIPLIFFVIAAIYSTAGFGGGSSYLAVLALLGLHYFDIKTIALLCNIVVVSGNLLLLSRRNLIILKNDLPLCLISIPLAFIGGLYELDIVYFFYLLGASLLLASLILMVSIKKQIQVRHNKLIAYTGSGFLGLLSGLVGIGGGIFLSPLLNIIGWDTPKKIAATASLFILLNSSAGLAGHIIRASNLEGTFNPWVYLPALVAVALGGWLGVRAAIFNLKQYHVKIVTAVLVFIAGIKILADHL